MCEILMIHNHLNDGGEWCNVDTLAHIPVLEQTLLGDMGLLEVNTELQVLVHDLLN